MKSGQDHPCSSPPNLSTACRKDITSLVGKAVLGQENLILGHGKMRQGGRKEDRKTILYSELCLSYFFYFQSRAYQLLAHPRAFAHAVSSA